jgi:low affinity Fe/Cu permease
MADHAQRVRSLFPYLSSTVARLAGRPETVLGACLLVVVWLASGPVFGFSDAWQLVINTGTTIVTFLMVFIIQDSQNRDTAALHLKIDELIRATDTAQNNLLDLEELSQEELDRLREKYVELAHRDAGRQARLTALEAEHRRRKERRAPKRARQPTDS